MACAFTYGSFGDIVETARIAKRIIDVLRSGRASYERQKVISALKGIHDDVATLSTFLDLDSSSPHVSYIAGRLAAELTACHSLMQRLFAKMNRDNSVMGRILMALSQETELISWRIEISERRDALHVLLDLLSSSLSLDIKSQVLQVGSEVHNVDAHVQNIAAEVRNSRALTIWGIAASHLLVRHVSSVGSQVQQVHRLIQKISPRDILDPVFFLTDPLGRTITIQLSYCDGFNDLDRILKAHLHNRPQAGSRYVERGDYNVVSPSGVVIRPFDLAAKLRAGIQFDISIVKRRRDRPTPRKCPQCNHTNQGSRNNGWIHCSTVTCGQKYQITTTKARVAKVETFSPQTFTQDQDHRTEFFRLVQIEAVYDALAQLAVSQPVPRKRGQIKPLRRMHSAGSLSQRQKNNGPRRAPETTRIPTTLPSINDRTRI